MRYCSQCKEEITPENEDVKMKNGVPVSNGRRCIHCRRAYQIEYYHRTKCKQKYPEPTIEQYIEKYGERIGRGLWNKYSEKTERIRRIESMAKEHGLNVNSERDTEKILRIEHGQEETEKEATQGTQGQPRRHVLERQGRRGVGNGD